MNIQQINEFIYLILILYVGHNFCKNFCFQVALEVLSYHNAASIDEVEDILQEGVPEKTGHEDISS